MINHNIEAYARANSRPVPELLEELRQYTHDNIDMPQMQVGSLEGNLLKVLVRITGAKRILEVGTFTGYSGLMMASGLPEDGQLITCELDEKIAGVARSFFDRSPHGKKIQIKIGPALESLNNIEGPFDMAFIDADKVNYTRYFDNILPKMRSGGLIVIDNVFWGGRVLHPPEEQSESTRAIASFNQHVRHLHENDRVMLTVRDGMTLVVT
jgi:caffeoyl-CoA O-methyltransferase